MPDTTCPACNGPHGEDTACPPKPRPTRTVIGLPFYAKYEGYCRECNLPTYPNQLIVGRTGRLTRDVDYVHEGCA